MADMPIKVAVLEGDIASLCALGFPLLLSLQLQQSCLRLIEAMWTAKSSSGGSGVPLILKSPSSAKEEKGKKKSKGQKDGINYD